MPGDDGKGNKISEKQSIPMSSPLYLHPSDNPNLMLTQIIFNGDNYDLWADAVKNGLDAKNKLGFIEGEVKKPEKIKGEENLELVAWRQCNAMLKAWLRNVIDPKLHPSITFSLPTAEVWDELKGRYSAENAPRVHQLKGELNECKQGRQSVVEYYTRLKTIWDELAQYSKVSQCTCGAAETIAKKREEERVHQFLMGLDTSLYGHIRTNLLIEDPITSLTRAYALVLREERHTTVTKLKEERNEAAMAVKNYGAGRGRGVPTKQETDEEDAPPQCTHCGKYYHTEENCYDKHGYEVVKNRERGRGRRGGGGSRGSYGRGRGGRSGAHQQNTFQANVVGSSSGLKETEAAKQNLPFTNDEIERIRSLLNSSPEGSNTLSGMHTNIVNEWLIDSGASHHMTEKRECLKNIRTEKPSIVGLPDGRSVEAQEHKEIALSDNFVLKDVFFVPSLTCDLISVQQSQLQNSLWTSDILVYGHRIHTRCRVRSCPLWINVHRILN